MKTKQEEPEVVESFALNNWLAEIYEPVGDHVARKSKVTIKYCGKVWFRGFGRMVYRNAKELIGHLEKTGYIPQKCGKCAADRELHDRIKTAIKSGEKETPLLEGLIS